jgi:eukaryotic-like serine/threonine-protein kinase
MQTLGRYRIEGRLGEGAMADVFRALDPDIGRVVAIKALKPDYRRDPELCARFLREARAAGALNHPHIATIYDVGEAEGVPYIAMELIEGTPLDAFIQAHGRMPYERVLTIATQLSSALGYAHAQGVVHRDIKPSNILLSDDGRTAKLLDFGVARIGGSDSDQGLARTQAGQLVGTPRYMSPEQALGLPVDQRSDLFSLGAVLYEMVTGKTAFDASGLATLALQIIKEKVTPIERSAADCPPGLRQIVEKLLAKKPEHRFADGAALSAALARETAAHAAEDAAPRRGLSIRVKLPLALVAITLAVLIAGMSLIMTRQQRALEHMAITSGEVVASFVSKHAAISMADNAGLPQDQQDWLPLQAFVAEAGRDGGVSGIIVADATGAIRAASDANLIGRRHRRAEGERAISQPGELAVTTTGDNRSLRFVRPIRYAGADFGTIDILLSRTPLDTAMVTARNLVIALSAIVMLVVLAMGYFSGAMVVRPLRRLLGAIDEAVGAGFAHRISHKRRDEIGALFDGFNRMAAAAEPRFHDAPVAPAVSLEATQVQPLPRRAA